jgi:hypothetical protein
MQYRFILKDNNQKAYRGFTWFLFFLHLVAAGVIAFNAVDKRVKLSLYILMGIYLLAFVIYYLLREKKNAWPVFSAAMALLYAGFWVIYVGTTALLIFASVYFFVTMVQQKKTTAGVSAAGVHLKRVFTTILYPWQQLDNVILKDNLLTIDFKSNKLMQAELEEGDVKTDEEGFNRFCRQQLQNNP